MTCVIPLCPGVTNSSRIAKISILKLERTIKMISYERRDYESVDKKEPILGNFLKNNEKKNSGSNGLNKMNINKFV